MQPETDVKMSKLPVSKTSCVLSVVVFALLCACVGLLVFLLKGELQQADRDIPKIDPDDAIQADDPAPLLPIDDAPWQHFRLPTTTVPIHYDLLLAPDLLTNVFVGKVNVTVKVSKRTRYLVVHAHRLNVWTSRVFDVARGVEVEVEKAFQYGRNEYFVVETKEPVDIGKYRLYFEFQGALDGGIVGFYKSKYRNSNNETRYLATSKFQPTYARRAFPCFDEPGFKSTFSISLVHGKDYIAVSNMPVEKTEPYKEDDGLLITTFQKSVPMVTYLACFIVCDFQYADTKTASGKPFRVYSIPDLLNTTSYALETGVRVLDYFEKYFGIKYPLPKQDMFAIPDFSSGAMEHWGIITFRETNLLYDPENSSPKNKQRIAFVISHEMAHMWFGNLVTLKWWDDLWLNEGFASYIEYKGVNALHPEWDILSQFVVEDLQPVMNIDSTMSSHPIVQTVTHPDEITEIFDMISYLKGASILRMLEHFVGKDEFKTGISNFLMKYKYQNAKTADLWEELTSVVESQGNRPISNTMKFWTEQMGFPYITVTVKKDSSTFTFKQKRFLRNINESLRLEPSKNYIWSVPLSYRTSSGKSGLVWLHDREEEYTLPIDNSKEWIKFNVNQTGFYIVNYDEEGWEKLTNLLLRNHEDLTPTDRSNVLFDSFLLSEAGVVGMDTFLSITKYLKKETHFVPWKTAHAAFKRISHLVQGTETETLWKGYIRDLTNDLYEKLFSKESENHLDNLLTTTITELACLAGNTNCLTHVSGLFQNWTLGLKVSPAQLDLMYKFGMSEQSADYEWNLIWNRYLSEESPTQKKAYLEGLSNVKKPQLIQRYLEYAMDEGKVRRQDFFSTLIHIAGNPTGKPLVWNFIREKWSTLVERFTLNDRYLGYAVKKICSYFTSETELKEMTSFFAKYPEAGAGARGRQQALEAVRDNIDWLRNHGMDLLTWLEDGGSPPWYGYRLPTHLVPRHYDLKLQPRLDGETFRGSVSITAELKKPSSFFVVHSKELDVSLAEVVRLEGERVEVTKVFLFKEHDYLVLQVKEKAAKGWYRLNFEFEGKLTLSLVGLYKSSYVDPERNETRYLATTQFEAIDARKAFPCFDEPSFKATFTVNIIHDPSHFALSNTKVESTTELVNGLMSTVFEKSPPMVTYLLCITVCDFKFKEVTTGSGVRLRSYASTQHFGSLDYSLELGSKILDFFEDYFGIPFPLKKLDMIGIPDFDQGAMENWGLITFAEDTLLTPYPPATMAKKYISNTVAHEMAHMWFGNLVTMEWWNDLWLNEGFATYMTRKAVQHVEPDLDKEHHVSINTLTSAMEHDRTIHSHAIVQTVKEVTPELFDTITYSKGASVLRMLENYMGEDFKQGVSNYLKKYAYQNAKTENLWEELSAASKKGLNVSAMMETWTTQPNYPYVTIKRDSHNEDIFIIQQHIFILKFETDDGHSSQSSHNYVWQLPLSYRTSQSKEISYVLLNSSEPVHLILPKTDWVKFNPNFVGYYSVNYDEKGWNNFITLLQSNHSVLSPSDRINLLFDAFSLASAGHVGYGTALDLTRYLKSETYFGAWDFVFLELLAMKENFRGDQETQDLINEYVRAMSRDLLQLYIRKDAENSSERYLKSVLMKAGCDCGSRVCLQFTSDLFKKWMEGESVDVELRQLVYVFGLRSHESEESWQFVWHKYLQESDVYEASRLQSALTRVKSRELLSRLMEYSKNESLVRKHEYFSVLSIIAEQPQGFELVTDHIFNDWEDIVKSQGEFRSVQFSSGVFDYYTTEKDLEKVKSFYKHNVKTNVAAQARSATIGNILTKIDWLKKHRDGVRNWFRNTVRMPWKDFRLPGHIVPLRYTLTLHPNATSSHFTGEESIELDITAETDYIALHQKGLEIRDVVVEGAGTDGSTVEEGIEHERNEFYVIRFRGVVPPGRYVVRLKFSGGFSASREGIGLYEYSHRLANETRPLVATRFQPTFARRVFPCFDEPAIKAKFQINLIHDSDYSAVSNMPVQAREVENGLTKTVFMESVPMSTYLLFFMVSDFEYLGTTYNGKQVGVYAPGDRLQEAEYGLNLTVKLLKAFEEYFDVPYALPKLDSIAIPKYGVPGMEHWGSITYNADRFLVNKNMSPYKRIVDIERVISHELVHQWIGNLVTMDWWDEIWLNEGISTLIMYEPLRDYYPFIDQIEVSKRTRMMCVDSSTNSHPIVHNVTTPKDVSKVFDSITYEKGAAVMKMVQNILKDDFRIGLSNFLKKYSFKTATTKDLWMELLKSSHVDLNLSDMMSTWTHEMGFPCVELKRKGKTLTATQHWFLRGTNRSRVDEEIKKRTSPSRSTWKIPLTYKGLDSSAEEQMVWLNSRNATFQLNVGEEDVLKFNPGFSGFYVVNYDPKDWAKLGRRLLQNHEDLRVIDRFHLLHDAFLLAESGRLPYDVPLHITRYLRMEKEGLPWNLFRDQYLHITTRFMGTRSEALKLLKIYVNKRTSSLYDDYVTTLPNKSNFVKWNSRVIACSITDTELDFISVIIDLACRTSNLKCLKSMKEDLDLWLQGKEVSSDLRLVFDVTFPYFGNDTTWEVLHQQVAGGISSIGETQKSVLAEGLASFTQPTLIHKTIEAMAFDPRIEKELAFIMFRELGEKPEALHLLWNFTKDNIDTLIKRFGVENTPAVLLWTFCEKLNTEKDLDEMTGLIQNIPHLKETVKEKCINQINSNIEWIRMFEDTIVTWLAWNVNA